MSIEVLLVILQMRELSAMLTFNSFATLKYLKKQFVSELD